MTTKEMLIKKLQNGGQITVEDLKSLGSKKKDPGARPAKVCSPKTAVAKAKKGQQLNKWELEELAKSPEYAVAYANLTGKRFPECERELFSRAEENVALLASYFLEVVKEKDENFEAWLVGDAEPSRLGQYIRDYCKDILKCRWEEGERVLLTKIKGWGGEIDLDHAWEYHEQLINGPWPEMEKLLLNKKLKISYREVSIKKYFKMLGPGRQEVTERRIAKSGSAYAILMYAMYCVRGRLPDGLHNKMVLGSSKSAKKYIKWLSMKKRMVVRYLQSLDGDDREKLIGMIPEETMAMEST
jgi:hypothetical protein